MNINSQFWVIGLFSLCLWACGDNDASSGGDNPVMHDIPIGFTSSVVSEEEASTRGDVITDVSDMYVFASYTGKSDWATTDMTNFMYMQKMTKASGSGWTYSPLKYWPNNDKDKISFFAYAPASITGIVPSAVNVAGPKVTYTVPTKESEKQDILLGADMNKKKSDATVVLQMKHVLSQIKFVVKNGKGGTTKVVKGLEVKAPSIGTASFTTDGKISWTIDTTGNTKTFVAESSFTNGNTVSVPDNIGEKTGVIATFFLLPVENAGQFTVSLTYTLQKSGEASVTELTATSYFPASPQWLPGSNITYTLSIVDDRLEIGGVTVESFGEGTPAGNEIPAT